MNLISDLSDDAKVSTGRRHHPWTDYYQAVADRPPRSTLIAALDAFAAALPSAEVESSVAGSKVTAASGFAVDLGCGNGRDTVELLRRGWLVLGIDGEPEAITRLHQRTDLDHTRLTTQVQRFETLNLPTNIDLINASFCLPFCPLGDFPTLWHKLTMALRPGGRFCGHLFGDRDSWIAYPNRSHHTRSQVEQLLTPFDIELLDEEEHPGKTALGEEKHWHIYNIVARRRPLSRV
ncbi:trans-aconitate 2-methyltransferase [cf. Phormidesmis sp. LEGE 11477]|uniref:class I SAM-dependent methyltransferase n=1 Tax=cf. Phormidesmis sp. LEGE 11477 TaxID=1828680 RepID=UPI00187E3D50|nr:class I SAM-dependent methyltransferase [cf. Phormidesmis sp. LEGE 11477]MBE9059828.1 class I SAM-dependent methyltransferase [cf. Phormidesmis sp. LEGE 11477]